MKTLVFAAIASLLALVPASADYRMGVYHPGEGWHTYGGYRYGGHYGSRYGYGHYGRPFAYHHWGRYDYPRPREWYHSRGYRW